ncbi:hypothetical protein CHS0354_039255 [Potamilus streckersoni]|uniref:Uncharacterized protein n=1 Tax=Potamilus streckersoni TaxID=2493646 RepID=A0AAE0VNU8_9BIVA|nr:hypothetical protein CHS0354_039255 [Potamilus streckersoni]
MTKETSFVRKVHIKFSGCNVAKYDININSIELEQNNILSQKTEQCHFIELSETDEDELPDDRSAKVVILLMDSDITSVRKRRQISKAFKSTALMIVITIAFISFKRLYGKQNDIQPAYILYSWHSIVLNSDLISMPFGFINSKFRDLFVSVLCALLQAKSRRKTMTKTTNALKTRHNHIIRQRK